MSLANNTSIYIQQSIEKFKSAISISLNYLATIVRRFLKLWQIFHTRYSILLNFSSLSKSGLFHS